MMTVADYEPVYQLWHTTKGMALRSHDDSEEGIAKFLEKNPDSNYVAEMNGERNPCADKASANSC